ncbi:hypothetical protein OKW30_007835 [Paraburkholderia sp. Clong3]|uniref:Phasin protein n=1 Tax=Paraburkholderia tuberum TaxID=157910 RepID=A0A1H1KJL1_9BURK|nr:hypothetical protein [Paraburkholderia tuberum]SDR62508.1 hypothetical protein SAMN05445850_8230 [Paraburkholderia tuberum]
MSIEVIPSQAFVYQQWVQGVSDSYEAFRRLADSQMRIGELALDVGVASLESFQSVLRVAIDENAAGKLLGQPLRQAMTAAVRSASYAPANDDTTTVPAAK